MKKNKNLKVVEKFIEAISTGGNWQDYVTEDIEWIVASANHPLTRAAIPWTGKIMKGKEAVKNFFEQLFSEKNFEFIDIKFTDIVGGENNIVAAFGWFKYKSNPTGKVVESDVAIKITLSGGKIAQYQFYENTYAIAESFRLDGQWEIENDGKKRLVP
ncbi:MAG: nuclear transport factor 2 family protein [Methanobacterium sp.]|nr:nuclear transport factor 2 family protein [Methanobacterium sp.]